MSKKFKIVERRRESVEVARLARALLNMASRPEYLEAPTYTEEGNGDLPPVTPAPPPGATP